METYDFGIGWVNDGLDYLFLESIKSECALRGLRLLVVDESSVDTIIDSIKYDKVKIVFFLDLLH